MNEYAYNEVVKGKVAGIFAYLGMRKLSDGNCYASLKPLNEKLEPLHGEICLPMDCIKKYHE